MTRETSRKPRSAVPAVRALAGALGTLSLAGGGSRGTLSFAGLLDGTEGL